jgi:hypothetical protein
MKVHVIRETHTSLVSGNFLVGKTMANLQRFFYCPQMKINCNQICKGVCVVLNFNPTIRKLVLYTSLHVPSHPWESISMDFVGGFPLSKMGHDYLYVVVDRFVNMCVLMPCKNNIIDEKIVHIFFQHVWVHFGLPTSIISD